MPRRHHLRQQHHLERDAGRAHIMPPMPPMPAIGSGAGAPAAGGSGASATKASAVIMSDATDWASRSAVLTTLAGSMMPASYMSTYSFFCASYPTLALGSSRSLPTTTAPSSPALAAMVLTGARSARWMISAPMRWSMFAACSRTASSCVDAHSSARPPPGTMPSSTAARVALSASTTRSFFSATSTSDAPPTLMTATPPESLARRSWSFSFS
mmetsp:Transcript_26592/g.106495  ORF Transcript_26592/g.106495 Transcript_26592/m.106495 type:complete len:213 (+) Transcript_26592:310-948(+)